MELKGKVIAVLEPVSGEGRNGKWLMQEFVLETEGRYKQRLLFEVWGGDKIEQANINQDDVITVKYDVDATERNGKWYGKNKAYEIVHG